MRLSVVVISYNMTRELPRTIRSLSTTMQRRVTEADYEILVVDNGSTAPVDEANCRRWATNLSFHRVANPTVSPVAAIHLGLSLARGELVGVFIDGARMASPGLLANALAAAQLHDRPAIGAPGFHLGPDRQVNSLAAGFDQAAEDRLLKASGWEEDGYRLFNISVLAGSSRRGLFVPPRESNSLFLKPADWRASGGYDRAFTSRGGGMANLDLWARLCANPDYGVVMLLGEATFHQTHGGIAYNREIVRDYEDEYIRIRGKPFQWPQRDMMFFGSPAPQSLRWIRLSAAMASGDRAFDSVLPNNTGKRA